MKLNEILPKIADKYDMSIWEILKLDISELNQIANCINQDGAKNNNLGKMSFKLNINADDAENKLDNLSNKLDEIISKLEIIDDIESGG